MFEMPNQLVDGDKKVSMCLETIVWFSYFW